MSKIVRGARSALDIAPLEVSRIECLCAPPQANAGSFLQPQEELALQITAKATTCTTCSTPMNMKADELFKMECFLLALQHWGGMSNPGFDWPGCFSVAFCFGKCFTSPALAC